MAAAAAAAAPSPETVRAGLALAGAAVQAGNTEQFKQAIRDHHLSAQHVRANLNNLLWTAASKGHTAIVKHLTTPVAKGGVGLTAADARMNGNDVLRAAIVHGHTAVVKHLTAPVAEGGVGLGAADINPPVQASAIALAEVSGRKAIADHLRDVVARGA